MLSGLERDVGLHTHTQVASVTLRGTVDGVDFCVQRTVTRRGLKSLRFTLGDDDMTCQEAKLTQAAIAAALNVHRLRLAVWHGQQTVGACRSRSHNTFPSRERGRRRRRDRDSDEGRSRENCPACPSRQQPAATCASRREWVCVVMVGVRAKVRVRVGVTDT